MNGLWAECLMAEYLGRDLKGNRMRTFGSHLTCLVFVILLGAALGRMLGNGQYAQWTQIYAEIEQAEDSLKVLANVPLVKYEGNFDFGILTGEPETLTHTFSVTNTGRGVLRLGTPICEQEGVSCILSKTEAAPDESIEISVSCTPSKEETDFGFSVSIPTNAPTEPELEFFLGGSVYPEVWVKEKTLEVAGVPTANEFRVSNPVYSIAEEGSLRLSELRVTNEEYAKFFRFEQTEMYSYDFQGVTPAPNSGQIVLISILPGLPNKVFTVNVEGKTNSEKMPTIRFAIDFKMPKADTMFGTPETGFVPLLPPVESSSVQKTQDAQDAQEVPDTQKTPDAQETPKDPSGGADVPDSIQLDAEDP